MQLIIAIPSEGNGGKPRRALASMQEYKELAFRTPSGGFVRTPITYVGVTTPHNNQELIEKVLRLHVPTIVDGVNAAEYCSYCSGKPHYPCKTVRILTGEE